MLLQKTIRKRMIRKKVDNSKDFWWDNDEYLLDSDWEENNNTEKDNNVPKSNGEW